jgi:ferredoxin
MHGPTSEVSVQVRILRSECCGNAQCVELLPQVFALDSKNKAVVLDPEAARAEQLIESAEACPCQAIVVEDDAGNTVFP